jgi:murein tripeptide amidase MpaA
MLFFCSQKRAAIFIDCGIHAREWISPAFCLYAIDRLLDPSESEMTDKFDFYIVPVTNPDGYAYTWAGNRFESLLLAQLH